MEMTTVRITNTLASLARHPLFGRILDIKIPMQIVRARREAQVLDAKFGEAYRRYRERKWFQACTPAQ
jgi:protein-S-isoprenylcysteine O-methyltransferase Ste14